MFHMVNHGLMHYLYIYKFIYYTIVYYSIVSIVYIVHVYPSISIDVHIDYKYALAYRHTDITVYTITLRICSVSSFYSSSIFSAASTE